MDSVGLQTLVFPILS